jgi:serine/threonine protein phosphatase PrpC
LQSGQIDEGERDRLSQLLDETADLHALEDQQEKIAVAAFLRRNQLWSELGTPEGDISTITDTPRSNINILLTSDGIHDNLRFSEIQEFLQNEPLESVCEILSKAAYIRSNSEDLRAKPDDMTCVLLASTFHKGE